MTATSIERDGVGDVKHTPTPWTVWSGEGYSATGRARTSVCRHVGELESNDHTCVADVLGDTEAKSHANAAFIVTAVNSHDALVKALQPFAHIAEVLGDKPPQGTGDVLHEWQLMSGMAALLHSDCIAARDVLRALASGDQL